MKIIVSGGNGFLASRITSFYQDKYDIRAVSHKEMDFVQKHEIRKMFEIEQPNLIIHCGAISDVKTCENKPDLSYKVNVIGTENIAKVCKEYNTKLIFCSSDQVYFGSISKTPHKEEEEVTPIPIYGKHKLEAEKRAMSSNLDTVCLRLSWMYDKVVRLGKEHGNLITAIHEKIEKKQKMSYPIYDYRSITDVWEVIKNLEKVFSFSKGVYNFGSENDSSTYEVVKKYLKINGQDLSLLEKNEIAFANQPRNLRMDLSKTKMNGVEFPTTLESLNCMK